MAPLPSLGHPGSQRGGGYGMLVEGQTQLTPGERGWIFGRWGSIERPAPADFRPPIAGGSHCNRHGSIGAVWGSLKALRQIAQVSWSSSFLRACLATACDLNIAKSQK